MVVFASFMCNLIVDGIAYTFGVFLAEFAKSFIPEGEPTGKVAWVGSLLSGVYLSVGELIDHKKFPIIQITFLPSCKYMYLHACRSHC